MAFTLGCGLKPTLVKRGTHMLKYTFYLVTVLVVLSSWNNVYAAELTNLTSFTGWRTEGGSRAAWEFDRNTQVLMQLGTRGTIGYSSPTGVTLPDEFTFSVDVGVISGLYQDRCPRVALSVHVAGDGYFEGTPTGYTFSYGEGGNRYQLGFISAQKDHGSIPRTIGASWKLYLQEWRRLTIVRTPSVLRTYVGGTLVHELRGVAISGGGIAFRTINTAAAFRNIRFTPRALTQDEVKEMAQELASEAWGIVPEKAQELAEQAASRVVSAPPEFKFTPAPGLTTHDYYLPTELQGLPNWAKPASDRIGTPGYPVWSEPYQYPWPYGTLALPYWRTMKYGTFDIKTAEISNAYMQVIDDYSSTEIQPNVDGEIRWPITDSFGEVIQWIHRPKDADGKLLPYWEIYDGVDPTKLVGNRVPAGVSISVQGVGAMYPYELANEYALVAFSFGGYGNSYDGWRLSIRAFLPQAALPPRFQAGMANDVNGRGMGLGGTTLKTVLADIPVPATKFPEGWHLMGRTGEAAGNYSNYESPRGRFTPFMGNTTGIAGGGIIRGLAKAGYDHIWVYDYFPYLDSNVNPVDNPPVAQWIYGQIVRPDGNGGWIETGMLGFIPLCIKDGEPQQFPLDAED
jgi:hypothetical protein